MSLPLEQSPRGEDLEQVIAACETAAVPEAETERAPEEQINDNVSRALLFHLLSPEDCRRITELALDPAASAAFADQQQALMPGYRHYRHCESGLIARNPDSDWLFEHLHNILRAVNNRHFHFAAERLEGAELLTLTNGGHLDWHSALGPGPFAQRKLVMHAFLSPTDSYTGGAFELLASQYPNVHFEQGSVLISPAFTACRFLPVTSGCQQVLVSWLQGEGPFC